MGLNGNYIMELNGNEWDFIGNIMFFFFLNGIQWEYHVNFFNQIDQP